MKLFIIISIILVFVLGWYASLVYTDLSTVKIDKTISPNTENAMPFDRIKEDQILVYNDKVILNIKDASWATYEDTDSMLPILDKGANGIEIIPQNENEVHIGDIVAYESSFVDGLVVHRVIHIGEDKKGKYFILKGDSNSTEDPEKVRFNQIQYVLIGVIY